ncbi:MAG: SDR family NAD(P)-dependent oxidoreductase, partial [Myxococcota bacterium]
MFHNTTAVITGAGSGIGRALALALLERGCHLALSDINPATLTETADMARTRRRDLRITTEAFDVADRQAFLNFARATLDAHGEVHIVINNAGVAMGKTVAQTSFEDLEWLMGINFWGVVHGTKAFLPHMMERGEGYIVNISSLFGLIAVPTQSAYNAAKFAVRGFTEALALELAHTDIVVSSVHPGGVRTNIAVNARVPDQTLDRALRGRNFNTIARLNPDQAAQIIIDGMAARQRRILVGQDAQALDLVQRLFPVGYGDLISFVTRNSALSVIDSPNAPPKTHTAPITPPEPMRPLGRIAGRVLNTVGNLLDIVSGPHLVQGRRLDPQFRALMTLNTTPTLHNHPPPQARRIYSRILLPFEPARIPMQAVTDLHLSGPHGPIPGRLYTPHGLDTTQPQPLLIWYHGGGFTIGSTDIVDPTVRQLAHHGHCRVASIGYRLAPEHPFPACFDDALHAFRGLLSQANALGFDPDRIAVGGDSAGGNLAAGVSRAQRDAARQDPCQTPPNQPIPQNTRGD